MLRMNYWFYEQLRPDGFIDAVADGYDAVTPMRPAGRPPARFDANERVRVTVLGPKNLPDVTTMLARCSRATLYKRFHGFTDGVAQASFAVGSADQDAFGAWSGDRCVGMASLLTNEEGHGEVGVLIEDAWQRRGAGSALVAAVVGRARELGLPGLVADVLADNYFVLPWLARTGAIRTTFAYSGYRVLVGLGRPITGGAIRADVPVRG
jgi:GNAT superfamily N-acetyltransferase